MMDQADERKMEAINALGEGGLKSYLLKTPWSVWSLCFFSLLQVTCRKLWISSLRPSSWTPAQPCCTPREPGEHLLIQIFCDTDCSAGLREWPFVFVFLVSVSSSRCRNPTQPSETATEPLASTQTLHSHTSGGEKPTGAHRVSQETT